MVDRMQEFVADAQRAHAELAVLRRRLEATARILRRDAEQVHSGRGAYEDGVAFGKRRGAEWIDTILRGDFDREVSDAKQD